MKWIVIILFSLLVVRAVYKRVTAMKNRRNSPEERALRTAKLRELIEHKEKIMSYPIIRMTKRELKQIPTAQDMKSQIGEDYLKTCPLGTRFICIKKYEDDPLVMGQLVTGNELPCNQHGSALCVPERAIYRSRVELIT